MSKSKESNLFEDVFDSAMEEVIPEEERIRYLASFGNFAHRNPIKEDLWNAMADLTIQGAALYTLGIVPDAICDETSYEDGVYVSSDALPKGYMNRLRIIKSAVRAGLIERIVIPGNTPAEIDDHTQILKTSFAKWCKANPKVCVPAEVIATYPKYQTESKARTPITASLSETLSTKERETMLKLIIGLAIAGYGYNPKDSRSSITGEGAGSIQADLAQHGINIDADTIRKYLKEAQKLLPS